MNFLALLKGSLSSFKFPESVQKTQFPKREVTQTPGHVVLALAGLHQTEKARSFEDWKEILAEATRLARESNCSEVKVVGLAEDKQFACRLCEEGPGLAEPNQASNDSKGPSSIKLTNLVGELSFGSLVDELSSASRLVSIDSGLVHVADYFETPSTVFFFAGNLDRWRPRSIGSKVIDRR